MKTTVSSQPQVDIADDLWGERESSLEEGRHQGRNHSSKMTPSSSARTVPEKPLRPIVVQSIFEEGLQMILAAIAVFAIADLRKVARLYLEQESEQEEKKRRHRSSSSGDDDANDDDQDEKQAIMNRSDTLQSDLHRVMELPVSASSLRDIVNEYPAMIDQNLNSRHRQSFQILEEIIVDPQWKSIDTDYIHQASVHYFADEKADQEAVWAIAVNHKYRRVVVSFRGSITTQDWIQDSKMMMAPIENPVLRAMKETAENNDKTTDVPQADQIWIHLGFRDYLYDLPSPLQHMFPNLDHLPELPSSLEDLVPSVSKAKPRLVFGDVKRTSSDDDQQAQQSQDETTSFVKNATKQVLDEIESMKEVEEHIDVDQPTLLPDASETEAEVEADDQPMSVMDAILSKAAKLLNENPGYRLYICGHSLGGALAVITSLEAAASNRIPIKPVTCVAVGNPKTGNFDFREAFRYMERQGKLRCLCIHNYQDLVPLMPDVDFLSCCLWTFRRRSFRHVGFKLQLRQFRKHRISYHGTEKDSWIVDVPRHIKQILTFLLVGPIVCLLNVFVAYYFAERHHYLTYVKRLMRQEEPLRKIYWEDLYGPTSTTTKALPLGLT